MIHPFAAASTAKFTTTVSNATLAVPPGFGSLVLYNAAANPVFFRLNPTGAANTAAVVPGTTLVDGLNFVSPGATLAFTVPASGGTLNFIADTAGGTLVVSSGEGA